MSGMGGSGGGGDSGVLGGGAFVQLRSRALAHLVALLRHGSAELGAHMPSWAPAALAAFVAGASVAAAVGLLSQRRRWSPEQLRLHRATPVLKELVRSAWTDLDAEDSGWLEAAEARAVIDAVLQTLQMPTRTQQLAALIAPPAMPSTVVDDAGADAAAAAPSAALLGSQAPAAADVELEVRSALARLWPALRRSLAKEFKVFLDVLEARPPHCGRPGSNFTPPANFRSPAISASSHGHSPLMANGQAQPRRHARSAASAGSSPPLSANSGSSPAPVAASSAAATAAAASAASASASPSALAAAAASAAPAPFDGRMFRCEFTTALVLWLEAKMAQQLLCADQNNANSASSGSGSAASGASGSDTT